MSQYIAPNLRRLVAERAGYICEYCLMSQEHSFLKFQIEHIISLKHGGSSNAENLALSCFYCNNFKGTDIGTILSGDEFSRFFNPRRDGWTDHFTLAKSGLILPKTAVGEGTIKILEINSVERLIERQILMEGGHFPHKNALKIINID